jgi:hypothetical protein
MEETDERIDAWKQIARHPFFAECYAEEAPLINSMLSALDAQVAMPKEASENTQAEEPVEWRILRAFSNGFNEGLLRGKEGRFDR